ncbi:DNA-binding response regulator, NarL/FixJ family, contains REC and HTH domains [Amycolatopsis arida]|uniref:DNA-binding response regulator, NarL/FixJ family, contains REC and HTH domains n=1 Tax=Amycolatopsis arida TaxID=587909 RepID=A0A1I5V8M6_9PSEU|nr:response regulator transcription factor [Amycolatopsis arida]TDX91190.1 DNA-binding NarL/FixJ family response regulator [Amycolatopsis arida]SFQ03873.1 DNA-binding response regulator, NarL/FixJ family, contains REC and HTH domains [Amycolatopsis arida]
MVGADPAVRIVVVGPQPLFSRGLAMLLASVSGGRLTVVASGCAAGEAGGLVRRHRPDVALVDLGLPPPGGAGAVAAIRRADPAVAVAVLGDETARDVVLPAVRAGARGVLPKSAEPERLLPPLLALVDGWAVLPADVVARLSAPGPAARPRDGLDGRDRRLWRLLATDRTLAQIAVELHVSERTAKRLTAALLRRLRVSSRPEAAALAGQCGLLAPPAPPRPGRGG